ncbi:DNA-processing protein DprA [Hyphomicrobium sp.]|uniref:DNA-processing protein DprA n=1 Tax=Hyphomicrobium sp. TaxID=82 RepID=UPI000FAB2DB5|nr:DNA-processing protein DprA [Hyphomicrobium sp.]RUO99333.1 MAG: DNA-protecting protein DprA [Hyphomicrobium sp.]
MAPRPDQTELFSAKPSRLDLTDEERLACLRLIRSENVGPVTFRDLVSYYGGAAKALEILPTLSARGGSGRPIRICRQSDAERELETARRLGAVPLFAVERQYPAVLADIDAPPPMIYVKGNQELLRRPAVAIVGSRQCSAAGVQLTKLFATQLAEAGFVIVSGLARGIDRAAHEASFAGGTVAVVAGGIDWVYPPEHAELQARIGAEGCLVSERPPGLQPRDKDFPRRNRIIAGLVYGVVVIEAAARSGTLVTARYANELGREVFGVPGHPLDPRAEGTNRLIKQGATMVTETQDILDILRPILGMDERRLDFAAAPSPASLPHPEASIQSPAGEFAPEDVQRAVLTALGPAPVAVDAITRQTGLNAKAVQIALLELDLAGRIERQGQSLVALKPA